MKKQYVKRAIALICVVVLCLSMGASALAARQCETVSGNANRSVTFTVNTKATPHNSIRTSGDSH